MPGPVSFDLFLCTSVPHRGIFQGASILAEWGLRATAVVCILPAYWLKGRMAVLMARRDFEKVVSSAGSIAGQSLRT
ncbi:hypothetical protein M8818_003310 [Zalaria obscura]|uniref:Uncharacterized protein n=1 Tax=Zalaria obscura TaxID=2024903 RepID=A0ACC3SER1_9PEZI